MKFLRERIFMAVALTVPPAMIVVLGIHPTIKRNNILHVEIRQVSEEFKDVPRFTPVSRQEKEFVLAPDAAWRKRIPFLTGDAARLSHYEKVVGELHAVLRASRSSVRSMRSSWDPIRSDFSVSDEMGQHPSYFKTVDLPALINKSSFAASRLREENRTSKNPSDENSPTQENTAFVMGNNNAQAVLRVQEESSLAVNGWLLDAEIAGGTEKLFRALSEVYKVGPLLEPVGIHWECSPVHRSQHLLLRNFILSRP